MGLVKAMAKLNPFKTKKKKISGSYKVKGPFFNFHPVRSDARFSENPKQMVRDQLRASLHLLYYYNQLGRGDMVACSLQKSALEALHTIYSSELNPVNWSKMSDLEAMLRWELREIIIRPYGPIDYFVGNESSASKIEGLESSLWELHDLALKLIIISIGCNVDSNGIPILEDYLTDLMKLICSHRLDGDRCTRATMRLTSLAHRLLELFRKNGYEENSKRKLLSFDFICNCLFPLACKFAAAEYPATIVDPIGHYESFESTGKLKEPNEALVEWNRRNAIKNVSGQLANGPKRGHSGYQLDDDRNSYDELSLPPTHVCLIHLIYELVVARGWGENDPIINFLKEKLRAQNDTNYDNCCIADSKARKLALMGNIVALNILGRFALRKNLRYLIKFKYEFVMPNIEHDCLPMKICKFQLMRWLPMIEFERLLGPDKYVRAYMTELIKIKDIRDFQDHPHKLFLVFAAVASEYLHSREHPLSDKFVYNTYLAPLDRELQLILAERIITLYSDYNIDFPLKLLDLMGQKNQDDKSFTSKFDVYLTKVINLLLSRTLVLMSAKDSDCTQLSRTFEHLCRLSCSTSQLLPDEVVEKFLIVATVCIFDDISRFRKRYELSERLLQTMRNILYDHTFPLKKPIQVAIIDLLEQILKRFSSSYNEVESCKLKFFLAAILRDFCFYQATGSSVLSLSNNRSANKSDKDGNSNLLFAPDRIMKIYYALIRKTIDDIDFNLFICCITNMLMSWPSLPMSRESYMVCDAVWKQFVAFIITSIRASEASENGVKVDEMKENLVFALMAAFSHDPLLLQNRRWNHLESHHGIELEDKNGSRIESYVKNWLRIVIGQDDVLWLREADLYSKAGPRVHISFQVLVSIHKARIDGKLPFLLKGLTNDLNSARRIVFKWLAELSQQTIWHNKPVKDFCAEAIRQLEKIGDFR